MVNPAANGFKKDQRERKEGLGFVKLAVSRHVTLPPFHGLSPTLFSYCPSETLSMSHPRPPLASWILLEPRYATWMIVTLHPLPHANFLLGCALASSTSTFCLFRGRSYHQSPPCGKRFNQRTFNQLQK